MHFLHALLMDRAYSAAGGSPQAEIRNFCLWEKESIFPVGFSSATDPWAQARYKKN